MATLMIITLAIGASLSLLGGLVILTSKNLIHCALSLAAVLVGVSIIFLGLGAEFLAFAHLLVYVGAVAILMVFAILLTKSPDQSAVQNLPRQPLFSTGSLAATLLASVLVACVLGTSFHGHWRHEHPVSVRSLGIELMGPHMVALLAIGLVLTAALIGAVVLAAKHTDSSGRDDES